MPLIACMGVLISWDMFARKSSFVCAACVRLSCVSRRASRSSCALSSALFVCVNMEATVV